MCTLPALSDNQNIAITTTLYLPTLRMCTAFLVMSGDGGSGADDRKSLIEDPTGASSLVCKHSSYKHLEFKVIHLQCLIISLTRPILQPVT